MRMLRGEEGAQVPKLKRRGVGDGPHLRHRRGPYSHSTVRRTSRKLDMCPSVDEPDQNVSYVSLATVKPFPVRVFQHVIPVSSLVQATFPLFAESP